MTLALNIIIRIQMCRVISMHKSLCIKFLQSKNSIHFGINYPLVLHQGVKGAQKISRSRTWKDCLSQGVPNTWGMRWDFPIPPSGNLFDCLLFLGPFLGCGMKVGQASRCLDMKCGGIKASLNSFPVSLNIFLTFVRLKMQIIG